MGLTLQQRRERLLNQLENPILTEREIQAIREKLEMLRAEEDQ